MNAQILITHGTVLTLGAQNQVIHDGALLIEGDKIAAIGTSAELGAAHKGVEVIDAKGRIVMPGFICAHHHLYSTLCCGLASKPGANFVEVLENLWWKLDRALTLEDTVVSAQIPILRAIRSGTTTIFDHHAAPNAIRGGLDAIADVVLESGVRASLCYEVTDRNGQQGTDDGIAESRAFLDRAKADKSGRLHGLVGLHAAMTISQPTLDKCVALVRDYDSGFHVHVAEGQADQDDSLAKYGKRVVERLNAAGALGKKTMAIHCIHIDDHEIDLLRETNTTVVHNPQSNMNNAVGAARIIDMIQKGIRVGLGTDGMTSDMREEARCGLWLRHHTHQDPRVGFMEIGTMLTQTNAAIASDAFGQTIGALEVGAAADVIISDHIPFTPIDSNNVLGHILFGVTAAPIDTTIAAGKVLMKNKELLTMDAEKICAKAAELSPKTWERFAAL
ncbi:MAG: putative aminohydrolase SsnA [Myxococcales bacterium]|jgi:putative selenium metabolism protein SsnA|nr:putative aminohydrolase SsnA [Myxococcales bacterium]